MSKRYARSGNTNEALTIPATDCRELMSVPGGGFHSDRVFWLRHIWAYNSHATDDAVIQVYDEDENAAGATAALERFSFSVPAGTLGSIDIPAPGIMFVTNITASVTGGTIAIYQAGASGYEEG